MKLKYTKTALRTLNDLPAPIRKAFRKQGGFIARNLQHPSLHSRKYDESEGRWQARVNHIIEDIIRHPK